MTRTEAVDLLMLLSALESWALSQEQHLPDYLCDRMADQITLLRTAALKEPSCKSTAE